MFFIRRLFSGASPSSTATMEAAKANIIEYIKDPRGVTMFSKTWCPYCQGAQARINQFLGEYKPPSTDKNGQPKVTPDEKQPYKVLELDFLKDQYMQNLLNTKAFAVDTLEKEGLKPKKKAQATVPNIWIGGEQIGGASDLDDLSDEQIRAKLEAAGAKLL